MMVEKKQAHKDPEQTPCTEGDKRCGPQGTWEVCENGRWEDAGIGNCAMGETSPLV